LPPATRPRGAFAVAKVGDVINDVPASAAADVGIAIVSGTDFAFETTDEAVPRERIGDVLAKVNLHTRTMRNIYQKTTIPRHFSRALYQGQTNLSGASE
jgi:cation transport ATPase